MEGFATAVGRVEGGLLPFYPTFLHVITFRKLSVQQDVSHLMASEDKPSRLGSSSLVKSKKGLENGVGCF